MTNDQIFFTRYTAALLLCLGIITNCKAQSAITYNLASLFKENRIVTVPAHQTRILGNTLPGAITTKGIVWLKGVAFTEGTIDIDLRGKDVFLNSFLGIAFHGIDTTTCDILYFRPFNFSYPDTARRRWSVAYMSLPAYGYARLRKEHPLIYENAVNPVPVPDAWFHATLVLKNKQLSVYVNRSKAPSLVIKLLNDRTSGLFGLYSDGLTEDFANLTITP